MTDYKLSQLSVKSSPAASTDYLPLLDTTDTSTAPAGAGGSDKRATIASVVNSVTDFAPSGLTGAVAVSRYAGATASGAPATGTFAVGDFVVDRSGTMWLCTTAGSPGTWVALVSTTGAQTVGGAKTFTEDLLVSKGSGYANGIFSGPGDGAQYSNFNLADDVLPLDGLGHYWAFSHRADSPVHSLLIFNYNGAGTYTNVIQITEAGAITSLHSTLEDGSGNMTLGGGLAAAVRTITTSGAVGSTDSLLLLNAATLTATLPTAAGIAGRQYTVKLIASATTGTVATTSSQTIDGSTTYSLSARYKYVTVVSDGTGWQITANN